MKIRRYNPTDFVSVSNLFCDTVNCVNAADYTREQLTAWIENSNRLEEKRGDLSKQFTLIAEYCGKIVGFGSIDENGYLDLLFVHKDYQNQGIASALCDKLEKDFLVITAYASITAKPFFEKRGYVIIKEQEVECLGVKLKNFKMQKIKAD
ncbi:MAG: GNAT family N-acetyltransferase [Clostridia bacterium]|nr:GNAT family N-acetyltransferase [Clostridia bacterium]